MMPFAGATELQQTQVVSAKRDDRTHRSRPGAAGAGQRSGELDGEARIYRLPGAQGELGFISSVSLPFCATCTRARLTADGKLRLCLLRDKEVDLLTPLRAGRDAGGSAQADPGRDLVQTLGSRAAGRRVCPQPGDERNWGVKARFLWTNFY